jgi:hypothetical protein
MGVCCSIVAAREIQVTCAEKATVFVGNELRIGGIPDFPDTQVHDAYDADRDGRWVRLVAVFTHADGTSVTAPGFAMRERSGGPWVWRVRWSPYRAGRWTGEVRAAWREGKGGAPAGVSAALPHAISVNADKRIEGPLCVATGKQNPRYLRIRQTDGSSKATWLFGACRAWVVRSQDKHNDWAPHEWLDRETELFAPMRDGGYNVGVMKDARPDIFGWHWYPGWGRAGTWDDVWSYAIRGVKSYAEAPIGRVPRLISEFGAADRDAAADAPSRLYPTLYHHAIWAAVFSGQAGTPMDWDDGKEFGELRWRKRKGIFDRQSYPIDHTAEIKALRRFLKGLDPDGLAGCDEPKAPVTCRAKPGGTAIVCALHGVKRDRIVGWVYATEPACTLAPKGLAPGTYRVTWHDPWTGSEIAGVAARTVTVTADAAPELDALPALKRLRAAANAFPKESRRHRGCDTAFKVERVR